MNIASAPLKLSNLKQPIYYKLQPKIIANYGSFIAHHDNPNYKLLQKLLQITAALIFVKFKIITNYVKFYYILRQLLVLLQITATFITNYGKYYKL